MTLVVKADTSSNVKPTLKANVLEYELPLKGNQIALSDVILIDDNDFISSDYTVTYTLTSALSVGEEFNGKVLKTLYAGGLYTFGVKISSLYFEDILDIFTLTVLPNSNMPALEEFALTIKLDKTQLSIDILDYAIVAYNGYDAADIKLEYYVDNVLLTQTIYNVSPRGQELIVKVKFISIGNYFVTYDKTLTLTIESFSANLPSLVSVTDNVALLPRINTVELKKLLTINERDFQDLYALRYVMTDDIGITSLIGGLLTVSYEGGSCVITVHVDALYNQFDSYELTVINLTINPYHNRPQVSSVMNEFTLGLSQTTLDINTLYVINKGGYNAIDYTVKYYINGNLATQFPGIDSANGNTYSVRTEITSVYFDMISRTDEIVLKPYSAELPSLTAETHTYRLPVKINSLDLSDIIRVKSGAFAGNYTVVYNITAGTILDRIGNIITVPNEGGIYTIDVEITATGGQFQPIVLPVNLTIEPAKPTMPTALLAVSQYQFLAGQSNLDIRTLMTTTNGSYLPIDFTVVVKINDITTSTIVAPTSADVDYSIKITISSIYFADIVTNSTLKVLYARPSDTGFGGLSVRYDSNTEATAHVGGNVYAISVDTDATYFDIIANINATSTYNVVGGIGGEGISVAIPTTTSSQQVTVNIIAQNGATETYILNISRIVPVTIGLVVDYNNVKRQYAMGDSISYSGLVVSKVMSNGKMVTIADSEYSKNTDFDSSTPGDYTVTISLLTFSKSYAVTVALSSPIVKELIAMTSGVKTVFALKEGFSSTGLVVRAVLTDSTVTTLLDKEYSLSSTAYTPNIAGKYSITITHYSTLIATSYIVTVLPEGTVVVPPTLTVKSMHLITDNAVTKFKHGAAFSSVGLVVKAVMSDDSTVTLSDVEFTINSDDYLANTAGIYTIIVTHKTITATYDVEVLAVAVNTVVELVLNTSNVKINYAHKETFNPNGLVVTAIMSNGVITPLTDKQYEVDKGLYVSTIAAFYTITVSYGGKSAIYTVQVHIDGQIPLPIVSSIILNTSGAKTVYALGESFSDTGLKVQAVLSDNSVLTLDSADYKIEKDLYVPNEVGEYAITIRHTLTGKVATYTVKVQNNGAVIELILVTSSAQIVFAFGEEFSSSGLIVRATLASGTVATLDHTQYDISSAAYIKGTAGTYAITVTHKITQITATYMVTVLPGGTTPTLTVKSLELVTTNAVTSFKYASAFKSTGLVVIALMSDDSTVTLSDAEYKIDSDSYLLNTAGDYVITVTHRSSGKTATYTVTVESEVIVVPPTVVELIIVASSAKTIFNFGEVFSDAGLVVRAVLSNGSVITLTTDDYSVSEGVYDKNIAATYNITVTLTDSTITASYAVTVLPNGVVAVPTVTSIQAITTNVKTKYIVGDSFTELGLIVRATLSDATQRTLSDTEYEVVSTTFVGTTVGTYIITIKYSDTISTTYSVEVAALVPPTVEELLLITSTVKRVYPYGEELEYAGLEVKAVLSNGQILPINDTQYTPTPSSDFDYDKPGIYDIIIEYGGKTAKYTVTVLAEIVVHQLLLDTSLVKKIFEFDEAFSAGRIVVKAVKTDGSILTLVSGQYDMDADAYQRTTPGTYTIKFTYSGTTISATYKVEVMPEDGTTLAPSVVSLIVDVNNAQTKFAFNEGYKRDGIIVQAVMSDGGLVTLKSDEYYLDHSQYIRSKAGKYAIIITSGIGETGYLVEVLPIPVLTVVNIVVNPTNAKTSYLHGEAFEKFGLLVTAVMSDGSTKELTSNEFEVDFSKFDPNTATNHTITVKYKDNLAILTTYAVTVTTDTVLIEEIYVVTAQAQTTFALKEAFNHDNLIVKGVWGSGNQTITIAPSKIRIDSTLYSANVPGIYVIHVHYHVDGIDLHSTTYTVTVSSEEIIDITVESLQIVSSNAVTVFAYGTQFNSNGLVVKAVLSNTNILTLTDLEYDINSDAYTASAAGTYTITVTHKSSGKTATYDVEVLAEVVPTVVELVVNTSDAKTKFAFTELFNPNGLVVTAIMSDGIVTPVTDEQYEVDFSQYDKDIAGVYLITVSFGGKSATYSVKVHGEGEIDLPTVVSIIVNTSDAKTVYKFGEVYSSTGLKVQAVLSDASILTLESGDYTINSDLYNANTAGLYAITVTHTATNKTARYNVLVENLVIVVPPTLIDLKVNTDRVTKNYFVGQIIDTTNIEVIGVASDNSLVHISLSLVTIDTSSYHADKPGIYKISVSYGGFTVEFNVQVFNQLSVEDIKTQLQLVLDNPNKYTKETYDKFVLDAAELQAYLSGDKHTDGLTISNFVLLKSLQDKLVLSEKEYSPMSNSLLTVVVAILCSLIAIFAAILAALIMRKMKQRY